MTGRLSSNAAGRREPGRAARRVTLAVLTGALLCAAQGQAAADPAPPPPAGAIAAPASSATASTGTGTNYWASDNCHYFDDGGTWRSDMCALSITVDGVVQPGVFGLFQNVGGGAVGRELVRFDLSDPAYLAFSFVTPQYTLGTWFRVSRADPTRIEEAATTIDGQPTWISLPVQPAPQTSGPPPTSSDPAKDAQERELWRNYNNGQLLTGLLAAGAHIS